MKIRILVCGENSLTDVHPFLIVARILPISNATFKMQIFWLVPSVFSVLRV